MRRNKEQKSLEIFKKGFRKNEIVIYAIALMLVTAGYFNYTANIEKNSIETYAEETQNILNVANGIEAEKNVAKEDNAYSIETGNNVVNKDNANSIETGNNVANKNNTNSIETEKNIAKDDNNELQNENSVSQNNAESKNIAVSSKEDKKDDEEIGDAKLVNSDSVTDYFVSSKLERDTNYADMISTYTKILEDNSVSETQKNNAMKEITRITNTKNAISVCENILSTKGFDNFVVLVNNNSVNVVVKLKDKLTKEKVAQIQNIVSRELNSKIEDIHITEK